MSLEIDRRAFIASLGGSAVVSRMSHEARADALEDYSIRKLDDAVAYAQGGQNAQAPEHFPTVAEIEAKIDGSASRRGVGNLFLGTQDRAIHRLEPMPKRPTLMDFFNLRFKTDSSSFNSCAWSASPRLRLASQTMPTRRFFNCAACRCAGVGVSVTRK